MNQSKEFKEDNISQKRYRKIDENNINKIKTTKITLIQGNHDIHLKYLIKYLRTNHKTENELRTKIRISKYRIIGSNLIIHGDKRIEQIFRKENEIKEIMKNVRTIIIGHEHPAIELENSGNKEKYKCFLIGNTNVKIAINRERDNIRESKVSKAEEFTKKLKIIVLPSFNELSEGNNISQNEILSPLLKGVDISKFYIFIVNQDNNRLTDEPYFFNTLNQIKRITK